MARGGARAQGPRRRERAGQGGGDMRLGVYVNAQHPAGDDPGRRFAEIVEQVRRDLDDLVLAHAVVREFVVKAFRD